MEGERGGTVRGEGDERVKGSGVYISCSPRATLHRFESICWLRDLLST